MKIKSSAFENNQTISSKYTCDGENTSPPLSIAEVPKNTQSLVLIVDDPDAPAGTWVHWTIWNIDPKTKEIPEGSVPSGGGEGITSFGNTGYGGPCPLSGTHRYFFKIYALDTKLELSPDATSSKIEEEINGHILAKDELIGFYSRK